MSNGPLELTAPDIRPLRRSPTGIDYVQVIDSGRAGPHVVVNALMHGNEISGPIAILRFLDSNLRPRRGRLSISLANVDAFLTFDPANPGRSRFIDEDMNRVWQEDCLGRSALTMERRRAQQLRPLFASADYLLDLHSMQTASPPLMLCGQRAKGYALAARIGYPEAVVGDRGHAQGTRLIDYGSFADPNSPATAVLLEAGQHWEARSADVAFAGLLHFLRATGTLDAEDIAPHIGADPLPAQRFIEVTQAITVGNGKFEFTGNYTGLETIARAGEVIAMDDGKPIVSPYDNCVLIMPAQRFSPGLTAVRLGRQIENPSPGTEPLA